jgi:hypothetical protein
MALCKRPSGVENMPRRILMHRRVTRAFVAAAMMSTLGCATAFAQHSSTITYQGALQLQGEPYTGTADYAFRLWDAEFGGQIMSELVFSDGVEVAEGLFQIPLDFGVESLDGDRWMAISVRTPAWDGQGAEPPYTSLPGRQRVSASPYALQTRGITVNNAGDRVGIGTTEPLAALHIAPTSGVLLGQNASTGGHTALQMNLSAASNGFARFQAVKASGSEWGNLVLNPSGGNVGVGTTNPQAKLHVQGGAIVTSRLTASGGVGWPSGGRLNDLIQNGRSINFGPIPSGGYATGPVNVPGAEVGDIVLVGATAPSSDFIIIAAWVHSPNTVYIRHQNISAGTIDPPQMVYRVLVIKHG